MENNENTTEEKKTGFAAHPENINRRGRPLKGHSVTEIIKDMMTETPDIKKALGKKILALALAGDMTAITRIWSYLDGMPVAKTEHSGSLSISDLVKEVNERKDIDGEDSE